MHLLFLSIPAGLLSHAYCSLTKQEEIQRNGFASWGKMHIHSTGMNKLNFKKVELRLCLESKENSKFSVFLLEIKRETRRIQYQVLFYAWGRKTQEKTQLQLPPVRQVF